MPVLTTIPDHSSDALRQHLHISVGHTQEDQRHQVVIPHPQELEDGEGRQRRNREREDQAEEHGEVGCAINEG